MVETDKKCISMHIMFGVQIRLLQGTPKNPRSPLFGSAFQIREKTVEHRELFSAMVVLKVKSSAEVFRFRLERCDLNEVRQHLEMIQGLLREVHPLYPVVILDQGEQPLTERSLQEARSMGDMIRVELRQERPDRSPANSENVTTSTTDTDLLLPSCSASAITDLDGQLQIPSAPPVEGVVTDVWHNANVVEDPPPQGYEVPMMPQQQWGQPLLGVPQPAALHQQILQNLQQANQHLHQQLHQHLHQTREHVHRHVQQMHADFHTRHREMHQEMHRRCAALHQRAHMAHHHGAATNRQQIPPLGSARIFFECGF